ncbi:hypothetical protein PO909_023061 [Leuciscus waleckii]
MKIFEKEMKRYIMTIAGPLLDPLQFAYRAGRGVDDAKLFLHNEGFSRHLENSGAFARLLFVDFSSAFNLLQPVTLGQKLISQFNFDHGLVLWIMNFLSDRQQRVRINEVLSDIVNISTGTPQGCVLSPILFILYTNDCQSLQDNSYLVKYADDTVLLSLRSHSDQEYGSVLNNFISWCSNMKLDLNVSKTKEMIINFSRRTLALQPIVINGTHVEEVEQYKYLGTVFDNKLKFDQNSEVIIKKSHQRLFVLRKLNSFNVQRVVLKSFYNSFVESILSFSFICWFSSVYKKQKSVAGYCQHVL